MSRVAHSRRLWIELLLVALLTAVALFIRTFQLQTFPPGLYIDEAAYALDALSVLDGDFAVFFPRNNGREPFFIYVLALVFSQLGSTAYTVRLTAAICGSLTVATSYWMVREMFKFGGYFRSARWYAAWTALFLTFSYWHISLSRLGFRAITLPLVTTVAFALMWHTWRRLRDGTGLPWSWAIATGAALGLTVYTYTAGRMAPFLFLAIGMITLIFAHHLSMDRGRVIKVTLLIVASMLVAMTPLISYFVTHPAAFSEHAAMVSVFSNEFTDDGPIVAILKNSAKMALFFVTEPDKNPRHNPAQIPAFDPLLALWLAAGIGIAIIQWRKLPSLFSLLWFLCFLAPALLSAEGMPHSLRAIGLLPIVYVLPLIAMGWTTTRTPPRFDSIVRWLPLPFLLISGILGVNSYYSVIDEPDRFAAPFFVKFWELSLSLQDNPDDTVWVLPLPPGEDLTDHRLYTTEFGLRDPNVLVTIPLDEATLPTDLARLTEGKRVVNVLRTYGEEGLTYYDTRFMDPKGRLDLHLRRNTDAPITQGEWTGIPYTSYPLIESPDFELPETGEPTDILFGDLVRLTAANIGVTAASESTIDDSEETAGPGGGELVQDVAHIANDQSAWVVLNWQAEEEIEGYLKTSLVLRSQTGEFAGQIDGFLTGERFPRHPVWNAGDAAKTYHIVEPLPALPPGRYTLALTVYDDESGRTYQAQMPDGTVTTNVPLAIIEISPPLTPGADSSPQIPLTDAFLADDLQVVGIDLPNSLVSPGDTIPVTLHFRAIEVPQEDYVVAVELRDEDGKLIQQVEAPPGGDGFPTSQWRTGEVIRSQYRLPLEADTESGEYTLSATMAGTEPAEPTVVVLASVSVNNRPRLLIAPPMTHEMDVSFESAIRLAGVDAQEAISVRPGDVVTTTLVWQPTATSTNEALTRSAQLLNAEGQLVAQEDTIPCGGSCPATSWLADEYLLDDTAVSLPGDLAPGTYTLIVGFYDPTTQSRLVATDENGTALPNNMAALPFSVIVEE